MAEGTSAWGDMKEIILILAFLAILLIALTLYLNPSLFSSLNFFDNW